MTKTNFACLGSASRLGLRRPPDNRLDPRMFDVVLDAAREMLDCPIAVIDVRSASFVWTSSRIRPPLNSRKVSSAIQQGIPRVGESLVVGDTYLSELPANDPLIKGPPVVRAVVSVPLVLEDGSNLGSLCALDVRAREFAPNVVDQMKLLASCASSMIEMRFAVERAGQDCRRAEQRADDAEHREQLLKHAEQMAQVGAWWIDPHGTISWSEEVRRLHDLPDNLPVTPGRVLGLYSKRDRTRLRRALFQIGKDHKPFEIVADMHSPKGRKRRMRCVGEVHFGEGEPVGCHGIFQDVTDQQAASQALWNSAHVDFLTAIPNRRWFHNALAETIGKSELADTRIALLLLDIDRFKDVNDGLGQEAGDAVLRTIAERLAPLREKGIFVARLAGDEFALFLATTAPAEAIRSMAEHIQVEVARPVLLQQRTIRITCSTGIAFYPDQAQDIDKLLACANMALHRAKHHGRNNYCLFTPELGGQFGARREAIDAIRKAAEEGGIVPHYQPKLRLSDGALIGFEAICRLQHANGLLVQPTEFRAALDDPASAQLVHDSLVDQIASDAANLLTGDIDPGVLSFN